MKSNIALIGFMGSGKSAAGSVLAAALNMDFVDLDVLIEKKTGHSIADIFASEGENAFREMETDALQEISLRKRTVISCGGGIILKSSNTLLLKQSALIVYLKVRADAVIQRLAGSDIRRPLLETSDPARSIKELLASRKRLYEAAADITVDTSGLTVDQVVHKIKSEILQYESTDLQKQHTG